MTLDIPRTEIPLGVECAWPAPVDRRPITSEPRQRRLSEAWRRLLLVFRSPRRKGWAG